MPVQGSSGDDAYDFTLSATPIDYRSGGGDDTVLGSRHDDVFHVEALIDQFPMNVFYGGVGDDTFYGGYGRNTYVGGLGADTFVGGLGVDVVSYARTGWPVVVDLALGRGTGGEAEGDRYVGSIDEVVGTGYGDTLIGASRAETLIGGGGADVIYGGGGRNRLDGGNGGDTFVLRGSADAVTGGAGRDTADYRMESRGVQVDLGAGTTGGGATGDVLESIELLAGSRFADVLVGDAGQNVLTGNGGADRLEGGAGADTLAGDGTARATYLGSDAGVEVDLGTGTGRFGDAAGDVLSGIARLDGSAFGDVLRGSADGGEWLAGWDGDDHLFAGGGTDTLLGGDGADTLEAGDGGGLLNGGTGDDRLVAGAGVDRMLGNIGVDVVEYREATAAVRVDLAAGTGAGGAVGDTYVAVEGVVGSRFADGLRGSAGADSLAGGAGADTLAGGAGADTLDGGGGRDRVSYADAADWVVAELGTAGGTRGEAAGDVIRNVEDLEGSQHGDWLYGDRGGNLLRGLAGDDVLVGDASTAGGPGGDDTLVGGAGRDRMHGQAGDDTFVFEAMTDSGDTVATADTIFDFAPGDRIDLRLLDADLTTAANEAFVFVGTQPYTGQGEVSTYFANGETIVEVHATGGPLTDMVIRVAGQHVLTADDFLL